MSEHRVPMLGNSWRRYEDPARSRDPRVRALVGALATLPAPEPSAAFRAELRAQLVAIAPRIIAESADVSVAPRIDNPPVAKTVSVGRPKHADGALARLRGISFGRPLAIATSVLTAFVVLLGGAVWMSQKALPGDTLYGLKRASESFQLWMDGGDRTAKATDLLKYAGKRVDEAHGLASRASATALGGGVHAGTIDSHTADLISSTLSTADSDVRNATALLTKEAVASRSSSPLKILTDWVPGQLARLNSLAAAFPASSLRHQAQSSAWLVSAAGNRAKALAPVVVTGCAPASSDALGPDPLGGCATPTTSPTTNTVTPSNKPNHPGRTDVGTDSGPGANPVTSGGSNDPDPQSSGSSGPTKTPIHLPPITLPTLPTPTLPVGSCGIHLTVGPIPINLGSCPTN
ncbi:MAG: hypothetical protein QOJ34_2781 [Pseudonocardiales bacterium]|nr:hypothetical protein [Pseudonocardiales bacterium]